MAQAQTYSMWVCGKCSSANLDGLIFCPTCAAREGQPNAQADPADRTGKLTEVLGNAIEWSLEHSRIKTAEVLAQASKRGRVVRSLAELRELPVPVLDRLAQSYVGGNRLGATGSGFGAGLPGGLAAFATIPADIMAVIYFSLRCVSGISQSYGFQAEGVTSETLSLLTLAFASKLETITIGDRRLETFGLAGFIVGLDVPEMSRLAHACILKQLASHLTADFAKTTWATFLPVVGGVVNGVDNFWFLGEVGKRGQVFLRSLFFQLKPAAKVAAPTLDEVLTVEIPPHALPVSDESLEVELMYPARLPAQLPLVIVAWPDAVGRELAYRLAQNGLAALLPATNTKLTSDRLTALLTFLTEGDLPTFWPFELVTTGPGLLAFGEAAQATLQNETTDARFKAVVLINPAGPAHPVQISGPLLLHLAEADPATDQTWSQYLTAQLGTGLVSISPYPGLGHSFLDPFAPDYNPQAARWVWADSLAWFKRYLDA